MQVEPGPDEPSAGVAPPRRRDRSDEPRRCRLHLRLTAAEFDPIAAAARAEGITAASYAIGAALELAGGARTHVPTSASEQWRALVAARLEAQRIRDQLAQLAIYLSSTGKDAPEQLPALLAAAAVAVARLDRAAISFQPKRGPRK